MKFSGMPFFVKILAVIGLTLILANCDRAGPTPNEQLSSEWLDVFFSAYSLFDGSHLAYYMDDVQLVDEIAGVEIESKDQLRDMFEQAKVGYTKLNWVIEDRIIQGNRATVRGRAKGLAFGREFDVAFSTWLYIVDDRIAHQVDYVDYGALREQITPVGEQ